MSNKEKENDDAIIGITGVKPKTKNKKYCSIEQKKTKKKRKLTTKNTNRQRKRLTTFKIIIPEEINAHDKIN